MSCFGVQDDDQRTESRLSAGRSADGDIDYRLVIFKLLYILLVQWKFFSVLQQ